MKLIFGIGNAGAEYKHNKHNVGHIIVDYIAHQKHITWKKRKLLKCEFAIMENLILCKSDNFVNLSGETILLVKNYYKLKTEDIIVIQDEIDLAFARIKIKVGGTSGGHNGIKSIDHNLKETNYLRIRFGVGKPNNIQHNGIARFVLSDFSQDQMNKIFDKAEIIVKYLDILLNNEIELFRNKLNSCHLNAE